MRASEKFQGRIQSGTGQEKYYYRGRFQGINSFGDVTTLGRGGSGYQCGSAGCGVPCRFCQIYTDVDGVYTADPRVVPNAKKLPEITFADMLELASQGAQVLHNRSVELAKKYHVNMEVVSSLKNIPGTKSQGGNKIGKDEYRRRCQDG